MFLVVAEIPLRATTSKSLVRFQVGPLGQNSKIVSCVIEGYKVGIPSLPALRSFCPSYSCVMGEADLACCQGEGKHVFLDSFLPLPILILRQ